MLVLGVHAAYSFATAGEEESYRAFCELCAQATATVQPECVNFQAKPLHSYPMPSFHPIDGTDTWVYHEPWQTRVWTTTPAVES